jgi:nucleotide-binding universal stress UspA family protein
MAPKIIVSYDDTDNDRDALALGQVLAGEGGEIALAYVRHDSVTTPQSLEQSEAEELLARGVSLTGREGTTSHVVFNPSTAGGIAELAVTEGADLVVFGSDYRTARGSVMPGKAASTLLHGGTVAVALAPADFRVHPSQSFSRIGVISDGDAAPQDTAQSLAASTDASVEEKPPFGLLVIGSREGAQSGTTLLSAAAEYQIETTNTPVIVLPRDHAVAF